MEDERRILIGNIAKKTFTELQLDIKNLLICKHNILD